MRELMLMAMNSAVAKDTMDLRVARRRTLARSRVSGGRPASRTWVSGRCDGALNVYKARVAGRLSACGGYLSYLDDWLAWLFLCIYDFLEHIRTLS